MEAMASLSCDAEITEAQQKYLRYAQQSVAEVAQANKLYTSVPDDIRISGLVG